MLLKLDALDIKLLSIIEENGRITNTALADKLHLSPSACWERLHRLEEAKIIRGYRAQIAVEKLANFTSFLVTVELRKHTLAASQRFENTVKKFDAIVECYSVVGVIDYLLRVVTPDMSTFQTLMKELLESNLEIERYFTHVVNRVVKYSPGAPGAPIALYTSGNAFGQSRKDRKSTGQKNHQPKPRKGRRPKERS